MILSTIFAGIKLKNPLVVASSPLTETIEHIIECEKFGAAAIIAKSCSSAVESKSGLRRCLIDKRGWWASSTFEREIQSLNYAKNYLQKSIRKVEIPVFGSVSELTLNSEIWLDTCKQLEDIGIAGIQLDLFYFKNIFESPEFSNRLCELIHCLCNEISVPIIPKLNINLPSEYIKSILLQVGCLNVSLLDSISLPPPINIHAGGNCKIPNVMNLKNSSLFGSWQLPLTEKYLVDFAVDGFSVCAGGGIVRPDDMVELIMFGASAVQIASDFILHGYEKIENYLKGLEDYLTKFGHLDLSSIKGTALPSNETEIKYNDVIAIIDENVCQLCKKCVNLGFCDAIGIKNDNIFIDPNKCEGCSLCSYICNYSAISMN